MTTKLKCHRCGNEWDYNGSKRFYATCPDCRANVKIRKVAYSFR